MKIDHARRYGATRCGVCCNDLTAEGGVTIEGACEGFARSRARSRLEADGALVDAFGIVGRGFHRATRCSLCGEVLAVRGEALAAAV